MTGHSPRPETETPDRQASEVFQLPVDKIREGYYSDAYFNHTKAVLEKGPRPDVVMQVFQKKHSMLGGIDEALAILRECSGREGWKAIGVRAGEYAKGWVNGWDRLEVRALHEGDSIEPLEPVLQIVGPYHLFAHLETVYLGTLARRTLIGTNVREVITAANSKPILYFPARHDHWQVQTGDGYMAHVAGCEGVSTDAQASWWGGKGVGTVPHGLIAAFGGDTVAAALAFDEMYGDDMNVSVLVDFDNNCAATASEVAEAFKRKGRKLWGVRLDTSETMVDKALVPFMGQYKPTGVVPELVRTVRTMLDSMGHDDVKIIVSGGFNAEKIRSFEKLGVPVDAYGVGASLIRGSNDYTADVVSIKRDGKWFGCGKAGRIRRPDDRLDSVI